MSTARNSPAMPCSSRVLPQPFDAHNTLKRSTLYSHFTDEELGQRGELTEALQLSDRDRKPRSTDSVCFVLFKPCCLMGPRPWGRGDACVILRPGGVPSLRGSWALRFTSDW